MQAHTVYVISKADSIKYIMSRPVLDGRLAKWAVILKKFNLIHVSQKAIKGQVLANFLGDHLVPNDLEPNDDLPGEEVSLYMIFHRRRCSLMVLHDEMVQE